MTSPITKIELSKDKYEIPLIKQEEKRIVGSVTNLCGICGKNHSSSNIPDSCVNCIIYGKLHNVKNSVSLNLFNTINDLQILMDHLDDPLGKAQALSLIDRAVTLKDPEPELCGKCGEIHHFPNNSDKCKICDVCNKSHNVKDCNYECILCKQVGKHTEDWCSKVCKWCARIHPTDDCADNPKNLNKIRMRKEDMIEVLPLNENSKSGREDSNKINDFQGSKKRTVSSQVQVKCVYCGKNHSASNCSYRDIGSK